MRRVSFQRGRAGAGESINKLFAAEMLMRYPGLKYINREDDAGDPSAFPFSGSSTHSGLSVIKRFTWFRFLL